MFHHLKLRAIAGIFRIIFNPCGVTVDSRINAWIVWFGASLTPKINFIQQISLPVISEPFSNKFTKKQRQPFDAFR